MIELSRHEQPVSFHDVAHAQRAVWRGHVRLDLTAAACGSRQWGTLDHADPHDDHFHGGGLRRRGIGRPVAGDDFGWRGTAGTILVLAAAAVEFLPARRGLGDPALASDRQGT